MAAYSWPVTLPTSVDAADFSESYGALILTTPMDAGPAKMRRRGRKPRIMNVSFVMTDTQINTLETFINDTIKGTARFDFAHPRTKSVIEVRIIPSGEGDLFSIQYFSHGLYKVSLRLEQLPS